MTSTRTIVTGGAGFIGTYVTRRLIESGRDVVVFDARPFGDEARFVLGEFANALRVEIGSIEDWSALAHLVHEVRPDEIVHLATITNPVALFRDPLPGINVNLLGTVHALETARLFGVQRFVYFSSIGVLPPVQYEPIDAAHPILLPQTAVGSGIYGATKIGGEALCFAYLNAFGIDARIIRPSAVYGFAMQYPIYVKPMVEGAVKGEAVAFDSGGSFPRDYTHVDDVATLAVACLNAQEGADRIFYGATGRALVTVNEVAEVVRRVVPGARIKVASRLTPEDQIELAYRGRLDIENAKQQLGWQPRFGDIRDGIEEYVAMLRAYLEGVA